MSRAKSYYELLGLKNDASPKEVRKAYRKVMRRIHPDLNPDQAKATRRSRELNAALEILTDPAKRARYDQQLARLKRQQQSSQNASPASGENHHHSAIKSSSESTKTINATPSSDDDDAPTRAFMVLSNLIPWLALIACFVAVGSAAIYVASQTSQIRDTPSVATSDQNESPSLPVGGSLAESDSIGETETSDPKIEQAAEGGTDGQNPLSLESTPNGATGNNVASEDVSQSNSNDDALTSQGASTKQPSSSIQGPQVASIFEFDNLAEQKRIEELNSRTMTNSLGMKLMPIEPGSFVMGSIGRYSSREEEPHDVSLTKGFSMGVHEVTVEQFQSLMGVRPLRHDSPTLPVTEVTWREAVEFCERLSRLPEEKAFGRRYRLPTEAEWEYACRAGTKTEYLSNDQDGKFLDRFAWFGEKYGDLQPVGTKQPNAWGLYDMAGSVWEWCQDGYGPYRDLPSTDPVGPFNQKTRICRGGSWSVHITNCRSAFRRRLPPVHSSDSLGFRVVMEIHETDEP